MPAPSQISRAAVVLIFLSLLPVACFRAQPPEPVPIPEPPLMSGGVPLEVIATREVNLNSPETDRNYEAILGETRSPRLRAGVISLDPGETILTLAYELAPCAGPKTPVDVTGVFAPDKIRIQLLTYFPENTLCHDDLRVAEMDLQLAEPAGGRPIELANVDRVGP